MGAPLEALLIPKSLLHCCELALSFASNGFQRVVEGKMELGGAIREVSYYGQR